MDRPAFEKLIEKSLERLPKRFQDKLRNIIIEVEEYPRRELLEDMGITSGTLFGLYQGVPLTEREWNFANALPDRIVIYQKPIERAASTPEEMEEIVVDTVMHEIGHYFGFSDNELYEMMDEVKRRGKRTRKNS
jgi:predicted Zn-dependent protease with MMP-like domain